MPGLSFPCAYRLRGIWCVGRYVFSSPTLHIFQIRWFSGAIFGAKPDSYTSALCSQRWGLLTGDRHVSSCPLRRNRPLGGCLQLHSKLFNTHFRRPPYGRTMAHFYFLRGSPPVAHGGSNVSTWMAYDLQVCALTSSAPGRVYVRVVGSDLRPEHSRNGT